MIRFDRYKNNQNRFVKMPDFDEIVEKYWEKELAKEIEQYIVRSQGTTTRVSFYTEPISRTYYGG